MTRILLTGACGRMGTALYAACTGNFTVAAAVDINPVGEGIYPSLLDVREKCDVIVDFSHHTYTKTVLEYAYSHSLPVVIATTGHTDSENAEIKEYSEKLPVFHSRNMSLGVNVMCRLAAEAASLLDGFDIEIVEAHHGTKLDAPSGTALMLADEIKSSLSHEAELVTDRTSRREIRPRDEIGIHSIRGGTIIGEHEVIFCGKGETLTIHHSAQGRDLFAQGALSAAAYMVGKAPGFYDMKALLKEAALAGVRI